MIAFGSSISEAEPYLRYADPGIRLASEPDSKVLRFSAVRTVSRSYNLLLDAAAEYEDLEALVLVHSYAEIADPDLCAKVRAALADPEVAVVGCAGATGVRTIAWWDGAISRGDVVHDYTEHGGGEMPAFDWTDCAGAPAEVDAVDGFLMALSPWAVRNLRFDESLIYGHGYDVDLCLEARAAGRKVVTADVRLIQHRPLELIGDADLWVEAHIAVARKWEGRMPGGDTPTTDWRARARRAEAEREAARAIAYSRRLMFDARMFELQRSLDELTESTSWRITTPLRRANKFRRETLGLRRETLGRESKDGKTRPEVGGRQAEINGRRAEVNGRQTEVNGQRTEVNGRGPDAPGVRR